MTPPSPFGGLPSGYREFPMLKDEVKIHQAVSAIMGLQYNFDISTDPAITLCGSPFLKPDILREPATSPPLQEIYVVSNLLPWKLRILASKYDFVSVSDVLGGLYCALRIPVKYGEYEGQRPEIKAAVSQAFERRVQTLARIDTIAAQAERQKGLKRIDFMKGSHNFAGFTNDNARPNELIMHIR